MPWEHIGDCGSGQMPDDRDWILKELAMGISYVLFICSMPPNACELGDRCYTASANIVNCQGFLTVPRTATVCRVTAVMRPYLEALT